MTPGSNIDTEELKRKRKAKQGRFAWLARFLGMRHRGQKGDSKASVAQPAKLPYFGASLSDLYTNPDLLVDNIPKPVYFTAKALQDWVAIEGLFRVSGIFSEMNRMKETFEKGDTPDFATVDSRHSIAGLLELWFRELPEPITTHALYDEFMHCIGDDIPEEQGVQNIHQSVAKLPTANKVVLAFFLRFMNIIASHEDENKMGSKNLGTVFGSILIGSAVLCFSLGLKNTLQRQNTIIQLMIDHVDTLFPEYPFSDFFGTMVRGKGKKVEESESESEDNSS